MKNLYAILTTAIVALLLISCETSASAKWPTEDTIVEHAVVHKLNSYDEYLQYLEKNRENISEDVIYYDDLSFCGEFDRCAFTDRGYTEFRYWLKDENGVSVSLAFSQKNSDDVKNANEAYSQYPIKEKSDLRYNDVAISTIAKYDYFRLEDADDFALLYSYSTESGKLTSIRILIGSMQVLISTNDLLEDDYGIFYEAVSDGLSDYPTDGEETFISRLLDSTSATEAAAELKEKILAEQGAEE